jgi:hypothetical protein
MRTMNVRALLTATCMRLALAVLGCGPATNDGVDGDANAAPETSGAKLPPGTGMAPTGPGSGTTPGSTSPAAPLAECVPAPACDGPLPHSVEPQRFRHAASSFIAALGSNATGRDTLLADGAPQQLVGRFVYGITVPLADEDVDVLVQRECAGAWTKLGEARTTTGNHATVDGVPDDGGRVYFDVPQEARLAVGRHRVVMVAHGDGTRVDFVVDVLPAQAQLAISDVDGTLTVDEDAELGALATGTLPGARADAASVIDTLASKGYRIAYVTARPEWLVPHTRAFLDANGFPRGVVRTATDTLTGHKGPPAVVYKSAQLALLGAVAKPQWLFGNTDTDAETYAKSGLPPERRVFIAYTDAEHGGRTVASWTELVAAAAALPNVCKPR